MKDNNFFFKDYSDGLKTALDLVSQEQVDILYNKIDTYIGSNSNIFLLGNGGSQANAQHISGDYLKTFSLAGLKLKISCLSDNVCHLTAASNDLSYEDAYSMLVDNIIDKSDFLISIFMPNLQPGTNVQKGVRSLNLSVACGIAIYEAHKQINFQNGI